ncbi:MAG TPA: transcription repressor NadR [Bacillota bacterium]|jgi:transcriptional regulator of NAD metabolism|nr:DNA-binding transcriptional regulator [Clostridiales bacterium UBA9856]HQC83154.1 transcription repressor NadR [Bacillota bacterium]
MKGDLRRKEIIKLLEESQEPLSGTALASHFKVSRQVIVQDITLLRAAGNKILSTYRGYVLEKEDSPSRIIKVRHDDNQIADELYTIVDAGGKVLDVFVNHEIYGELRVELMLASRKDVDTFTAQLKAGKISPLKHLTDDYHYHTVAGDSEETLDYIEEQLKKKGYLM